MTNPSGSGRRSTLADVAARAGVSRALASMVMRNVAGPGAQSRERVEAAAVELNYRPDPAAQVLRRHRSRLIGVVLSLRDTFQADLVEAIYPAAQRLGYEVVLGARIDSRTELSTVDALLGSRCEGMILLGSVDDRQQLRALGAQVPVVAVGRSGHALGLDTVRTADDKGVQQAVDHLISLGHRDILHIDGGRGPGAGQRRRGYRDAMRRNGFGDLIRIVAGHHTEEAGGRATRELIETGLLPTAIVASNDRSAVGVLDALIRAGVAVPEQVSVVGYDDSQLARLAHTDLTTVRQDATRMAEFSVQAIAERLDDGRTESRDMLLDPALVIRGTTGPAAR